jgi:hypothetical protein
MLKQNFTQNNQTTLITVTDSNRQTQTVTDRHRLFKTSKQKLKQVNCVSLQTKQIWLLAYYLGLAE